MYMVEISFFFSLSLSFSLDKSHKMFTERVQRHIQHAENWDTLRMDFEMTICTQGVSSRLDLAWVGKLRERL